MGNMYCPKCKNNDFEFKGLKKLFCSSCSFTFYKNTASGVGVFIRFEDRYLFAVRKNNPGKGMLDLPGGFVDPGESFEAAASRELKEELHLEINNFSYLFSFPNLYEYKDVEYHVVDVFFESEIKELPEIIPDDDVQDVVWIKIDEIDIDSIAFKSLKKAVNALKEKSGL